MAMFHMFLATPPAATPVASVYREQRTFGPWTAGGVSGFSAGVVMEVAETASADLRSVRACCTGWLRMVGLQPPLTAPDPAAPIVVSLTPNAPEMMELNELTRARAGGLEMPLSFLYVGLDPASLRAHIQPGLDASALLFPGFTADERWQAFHEGQRVAPVLGGSILAEISAANLSNGFVRVGFAARTNPSERPDVTTPPLNFTDPVGLYQRLTGHHLKGGGDAIAPADVPNSWLDVATTGRLLFTFRDEWNAPLEAPAESVVIDTAGGQQSIEFTIDRKGTVVAPPLASGFYTLTIADRKLTLPGMGASDTPMVNVSAAPAHYVIHTVKPGDWFHPQDPPLSDPTKVLPLYTEGNEVEALIDGRKTFTRIVNDLKAIDSDDHFFLFTNWWTEHDFELVEGDAESTLEKLMEDANAAGAPARALIWHHFAANSLPGFGFNIPAKDFIAGLTHGQAVLDKRTHHAWTPIPYATAELVGVLSMAGPIGAAMVAEETAPAGSGSPHHMGAHHAKTSVIRNRKGTNGYVGGVDFNPNRLDDTDHAVPPKARFHDVHSRIAGPAVRDLAKAFVDRWSDHPDNQAAGRRLLIPAGAPCPAGSTCITPTLSATQTGGSCMVQIARTTGATTVSYAPNGDRTTWATIQQAIGRARRYIYVEDQYLTSPEMSAALTAAMPHIDHLVIVIDYYGETIPYGRQAMARARYLYLKPIVAAAPGKVHVFSLFKDSVPIKIHTKVVIVDDVLATIGSTNMNRRGFTHDTEMNVFVLDGRVEDGARRFSRDLRLALWGEHLGWQHDPEYARTRLADVDRAVDILVSHPPSTSRLRPYDLARGEGLGQWPGWVDTIDPDGTPAPA
jgi:hypothetical protein